MDDLPPAPPVAPSPSPAPIAAPQMLCPQCHFPITPAEYFCPNCGKNLREAPLSTSAGAQAWLYIFSAVLPIICYLAISKWEGIKYARSSDPETRMMGIVAIAILIVSTIITFWLTAVWIEGALNGALNGVNGGGLGGSLGGLGNY